MIEEEEIIEEKMGSGTEKVVRKIANILGNITLGSGVISAVVAVVQGIVEQDAYPSQPWFIAFAVLMAISVVAKSIGETDSEES